MRASRSSQDSASRRVHIAGHRCRRQRPGAAASSTCRMNAGVAACQADAGLTRQGEVLVRGSGDTPTWTTARSSLPRPSMPRLDADGLLPIGADAAGASLDLGRLTAHQQDRLLDVWSPDAVRLSVGVADIVAKRHGLATDLTSALHVVALLCRGPLDLPMAGSSALYRTVHRPPAILAHCSMARIGVAIARRAGPRSIPWTNPTARVSGDCPPDV